MSGSAAANPNPWAPYDTYKDCSQGICSIYCPQWCYIIFPPPPPSSLGDDGDGDSATTDFSPLIIAVIGILASAFILVSYYSFISKYCKRRSRGNSIDFHENHDDITSESWQQANTGLDEALIKSITVCKYKKGDGLVEGTDCSVCLSEFQEDESLRLLPKCSHAFHLPCIDTWLKSHSSCPLCRANIASTNNPPNQETQPDVNISVHEFHQHRNDAVLVIQDLENSVHEEAVVVSLVVPENVPKTPPPNTEITAQDQDEILQPIRRSVSLNSSLCRQDHVSIADILQACEEDDGDDDLQMENTEKSRSRVSLAIKRSVSTGRFMFSRNAKGRSSVIPN